MNKQKNQYEESHKQHKHSNGRFNDNPTGKNTTPVFLFCVMHDAMTRNELLILE